MARLTSDTRLEDWLRKLGTEDELAIRFALRALLGLDEMALARSLQRGRKIVADLGKDWEPPEGNLQSPRRRRRRTVARGKAMPAARRRQP